MSLEDIKPTDTIIHIEGQPYKIAYDFNSIAKLLELFDCSFSNLHNIVLDIEAVGDLPKMLQFCYVGFLKYHPEVTLEFVQQYGHYWYLFQRCGAQFMKVVVNPDEWEKIIYEDKRRHGDELVKKKCKKNWIYRIFGIKR